jgi:hypothetical protein
MYPRTFDKIKQWLLQESQERRRVPRRTKPEIVAYYWDGAPPQSRQIRDVNHNGAYIRTPERWYVGTIIRLILQGYQTAMRKDGTIVPVASTCVPARLVRHGSDGVAVEFVFRDKREKETFQTFLTGIPDQPPVP